MAAITATCALAPVAAKSLAGQRLQARKPVHSTPSRYAVRVTAQAEEKEGPRLSFKTNERAAIGYFEEDSAGQTNIFAVEPRVYQQGSSSDSTTGSSGNTVAAIAAAALAVVAVGAGLVVNWAPSQKGSANQEIQAYTQEVASLGSLSSYADKFAAELGPDASTAPALDQ